VSSVLKPASAIVLVLDRLGAGWLAPYGNAWLDAPNFCRLAAQSVLAESLIADSPALDAACCGYWWGRHVLETGEPAVASLADLARQAGAAAVLLSDDAKLTQQGVAAGFAQADFSVFAEPTESAASIEDTRLFRFFDAARGLIEKQAGPSLLWLHSRGMNGAWDAPLEMRYQFADDDDPLPPDFIEPPDRVLPADFDPDELLGYGQAYAGQVALADMCLGMLLEAIDEHPAARDALLIVTSPRGYPLGEHRRVGASDEALYGELLHVPLLVRFPANEHSLTRCRGIVQPRELFRLIAQTCGWWPEGLAPQSGMLAELTGMSPSLGDVACSVARGQRSIRTPAWFLRESRDRETAKHELFAKPDDRWEANEVASLCPEAVALLAAELDRFEQGAAQGQLAERPPLAELLCDIWR
jgi:hypothetical protein